MRGRKSPFQQRTRFSYKTPWSLESLGFVDPTDPTWLSCQDNEVVYSKETEWDVTNPDPQHLGVVLFAVSDCGFLGWMLVDEAVTATSPAPNAFQSVRRRELEGWRPLSLVRSTVGCFGFGSRWFFGGVDISEAVKMSHCFFVGSDRTRPNWTYGKMINNGCCKALSLEKKVC